MASLQGKVTMHNYNIIYLHWPVLKYPTNNVITVSEHILQLHCDDTIHCTYRV